MGRCSIRAGLAGGEGEGWPTWLADAAAGPNARGAQSLFGGGFYKGAEKAGSSG
jgi:hypothetical protein